jgi:c-di-GMP-binding flagellar brake protein YcgR
MPPATPQERTDESLIFKDTDTSPQFAVGLPVFFELLQKSKRLRAQTHIVGWVRPRLVITSVPQDSRLVVIPKGTELIVRYLLEGRVYGFVSRLIHKQVDPLPLWMIEYPEVVEVKNLRRSPRIPITLQVKNHLDETWFTLDLSASGAMLAVESKQSVGDTALLTFSLPNGELIENLSVTVMRVISDSDESRIGVQFDEDDPEPLEKIKNYLDTIKTLAAR